MADTVKKAFPPMPPSPMQRVQTPIPRVPAVFRPLPAQPYHMRANPGAMKTLNLSNPGGSD